MKTPRFGAFCLDCWTKSVLAIHEQRDHSRDADGQRDQTTILIQLLGEGGGCDFLFHGTKLLIASSFCKLTGFVARWWVRRLTCSNGSTRRRKAALKNLRKNHPTAINN